MQRMDIDDEGLDTTDRKLLAAIVQKFASGPVGGAALAAVIGEEVETIEDVYEPYLLQLAFLDRTPQGRVATEAARDHLAALGYEVPPPRRSGSRRCRRCGTAARPMSSPPTSRPPRDDRHDRSGRRIRRRHDGPEEGYGHSVALVGLDLAVPTGMVYGFLGPNGAGKTTTLRCWLGLIHPDAGTMTLLGRPYTARDRRRLFGIGSLIEIAVVLSRTCPGATTCWCSRPPGREPAKRRVDEVLDR